MDPAVTQAMTHWLTETTTDHDSDLAKQAAAVVRDFDDPDVAAAVLRIGADLWVRQPKAITQRLDELAALHLALTLVEEADLGPYEGESTEETADRFRGQVTQLVESQQQAAFLAVRQLGGCEALGLRPWVDSCLGDYEHSNAPASLVLQVNQVTANHDPGIDWWLVEGVGFVLCRLGNSRR